jgi:hypothetical protein
MWEEKLFVLLCSPSPSFCFWLDNETNDIPLMVDGRAWEQQRSSKSSQARGKRWQFSFIDILTR